MTTDNLADQPAPQSQTLLVSAVDFGFGPGGKLLSIVEHLPPVRLVVVGSQMLRAIIDRSNTRHQYVWVSSVEEVDLNEIDAALIILDPVLANLLTARTVPVVYVDSLPHMWTAADIICTDVFAYCAQRYAPGVDQPLAVLESVRALHWVDPIAPEVRERSRRPGTAIVNVGGVHSAFTSSGASAYVRLVVPAAVEALQELGYTVTVTGNIDQLCKQYLASRGVECLTVEHRRFVNLLSATDLLVTSPGMTTMMEAGVAGIETVLLPPQNLSQILNATALTSVSSARVDWPEEWFPLTQIDAARIDGEEAALAIIYEAIDSMQRRHDIHGILVRDVIEKVRARSDWLQKAVRGIGNRGAQQVAAHVSAALGR